MQMEDGRERNVCGCGLRQGKPIFLFTLLFPYTASPVFHKFLPKALLLILFPWQKCRREVIQLSSLWIVIFYLDFLVRIKKTTDLGDILDSPAVPNRCLHPLKMPECLCSHSFPPLSMGDMFPLFIILTPLGKPPTLAIPGHKGHMPISPWTSRYLVVTLVAEDKIPFCLSGTYPSHFFILFAFSLLWVMICLM
jgi:hypothetical protein